MWGTNRLGKKAHLDQLCAQFLLSQSGNVNLWFSLKLRLDAAAAASSKGKLLAYKQSGNTFKHGVTLGCVRVQHTGQIFLLTELSYEMPPWPYIFPCLHCPERSLLEHISQDCHQDQDFYIQTCLFSEHQLTQTPENTHAVSRPAELHQGGDMQAIRLTCSRCVQGSGSCGGQLASQAAQALLQDSHLSRDINHSITSWRQGTLDRWISSCKLLA